MTSGRFRFDRFELNVGDRLLVRDETPVELNSRYLDALTLLVREQGKLVSKDRFLDEVWRGVPVTDEALTQCIRTLRRQLGDDAAKPRFIQTVPKHGYRFVAPVAELGDPAPPVPEVSPPPGLSPVIHPTRAFFLRAGAGTLGGAFAGLLGGLFYGFAAASQPSGPAMGALSLLLVLTCLTFIVGLVGGAGVGFGVAASGLLSGRIGGWSIAGAALGGSIVGAVVKLVGLDAFNLLFGQTPGDITGALEGALLGAAVGLGLWLAGRGRSFPKLRSGMAVAGLIVAAAAISISLVGGQLMGGSLDLLARSFPASRVRLDQLGFLFGETGFGPFTRIVTSGLEGMLFVACVVGAMLLAERSLAGRSD